MMDSITGQTSKKKRKDVNLRVEDDNPIMFGNKRVKGEAITPRNDDRPNLNTYGRSISGPGSVKASREIREFDKRPGARKEKGFRSTDFNPREDVNLPLESGYRRRMKSK